MSKIGRHGLSPLGFMVKWDRGHQIGPKEVTYPIWKLDAAGDGARPGEGHALVGWMSVGSMKHGWVFFKITVFK